MKTNLLITIVYLMIAPSFCWHPQIHSIIAHITQQNLQQQDPSVLTKIFDMLSPIQHFFKESKDTLLEVPVMPIEIARQYLDMFDLKYYSGRPIINWNESPSDIKLPKNTYYNITGNMNRTIQIVKKSISEPDDQEYSVKHGLMDSLNLRLLLKYAGNLHNPIRNANFYSKHLFDGDIIDGDQNGRKIPVEDVFKKGITNLMDLYDRAFDIFDLRDSEMPYSKEMRDLIETQADYLVSKYPEESFGQSVENLNFFDWALESFTIADDFTYSEVELFPIVSPSYIIRGRRICEERITLAGYRLYRLLIKLFKTK